MAHVIAVAGKGGVGKTTLCGMLIQYLCEKKKGPVLAVDADANSNLNEVLGVEVDTTLGDVREEIAHAEIAEKSPIPKGMSKADYAEVRLLPYRPRFRPNRLQADSGNAPAERSAPEDGRHSCPENRPCLY